jgi:hypothetical protein
VAPPQIPVVKIQGSRGKHPGNPAADSAAPDDGLVPAAVRRAQVARFVVPGAAAHHAAAAIAAGPGAAVIWRPLVVVVPAVLDPLPDIAMHVVEAPLVGRVRADLDGLSDILAEVGVVVRDPGANVISRCRSGPAGIFPLGLAEEAIAMAGLAAQPTQIALDVVPTYIDDGSFAPALAFVGRLVGFYVPGVVPGIIFGEAVPLFEGHRITSHGEAVFYLDPMLRFLRIRSCLAPCSIAHLALGPGRTHHEPARGNDDQLWASRFVDVTQDCDSLWLASIWRDVNGCLIVSAPGRPRMPLSLIWVLQSFFDGANEPIKATLLPQVDPLDVPKVQPKVGDLQIWDSAVIEPDGDEEGGPGWALPERREG